MKTWMVRLMVLGLAAAAVPGHAEPAQDSAAGRGPYEGVAASEKAVWVLDTRTGKVRKCTQDFADQTPVCSGMSN